MCSRTPAVESGRSDAVSTILSALGRAILLSVMVCAADIAAGAVQAAELTFDLRVENGRVPENMRLVRVKQGDLVKLRWTVDRPVILHLHGYDLETRVEPGAVGEMSFTAYATGRFPIHAHAAVARTGSNAREEAALVYVEVYPR
jgi:hypothetical protein